ncbi:MAG: MutS-related protein [Christensenellales bacterium]|jgi:hypothetical protein
MPMIWVFLGVMVIGLGAGLISQHTRGNARKKLLARWGQKPKERKLDEDILTDIGEYHRIRREHAPYPSLVDDTTWRDLDMDAVFSQMNFCQSLVGSEILHDMLRDTGCPAESLARRAKHISLFENDEEVRVACQLALQKAGKTPFHGGARHLYNPDFITPPFPWLYPMLALLPILLFIGGFFFKPLFLVIIPAFAVNMVIYYRGDMRYHSQAASIRHLGSVLGAAKALIKLNIPALEPELEELRRNSRKLRSLARWIPYFQMEKMGDPNMGFMVDFYKIFFQMDMISLCRISDKIAKNIEALRRVYRIIGEVDAQIAIAAWRSQNAACQPTFTEERALRAEGLMHPLLENPVANDFAWTHNTLITGSNASGKSTFIKALAVNAILAQTIMSCRAESITLCRARVMTAMAVKDSLLAGESYYIAETKALRRINEAADTPGLPLFCLVDEILRGTNTVERIAASVAVLTSFMDKDMLVINATHDVELVALLHGKYDNFHFSEDMEAEDMRFSYLIQPGPARGRNAIKLLAHLGFESGIVNHARELAKHFDEYGEWPGEQ